MRPGHGTEFVARLLRCAIDDALRDECEQYLAETRNHVDVLSELCHAFWHRHRERQREKEGARQSGHRNRRGSVACTQMKGEEDEHLYHSPPGGTRIADIA